MIMTGAAVAQGVPGQHFLDNWDLNEDGSVSLAEAEERRSDIFASFDANEDGALDSEEYQLFDEARATDMAQSGGQQGAGKQGVGKQGAGKQGAGKQGAGKQGGGRQGGGQHRATDGMRLQRNDLDGDGKVSRQEFLANAKGWFEMLDRNGDGVITTGDFGRNRS